ncbi:MAG: nucleoside:proton symporter [Nitrospinae bacterium]|nr:nucleoside:proton symporter [Nitrospinota bacterium]
MALQSFFGLFALTGLAWLFSERRRAVSVRIIAIGLGLQIVLAWAMLHLAPVQNFFLMLNNAVTALESATVAGSSFVFGYLGGGQAPFDITPGASTFIFAFRGLPVVLVMSALSSLFFYWRVLPVIVHGFAWALKRTMGIGGPAGLSVAANIFVGMVEAPLLIRPYLNSMTRSEIFLVMTAGMAGIAGTVMVLYSSIISKAIPGAMGHILTASIISAPAAIMISQIMVPETEKPTMGEVVPPSEAHSSMDAITRGTSEGVTLLISIVALLLVLVALVDIVNQTLGYLVVTAAGPLTLQMIFGTLMAPLVWLMGIPWSEAHTAGQLMGVKTALNELIAYIQMAQLPETALSPKSRLIMTYAMCGFANFGSMGIMIGGMSAMAPERRDVIVPLGLKSIVSGTLSTMITGAVVGITG